ncbi:MAG: universal stress protein [Mangrovibacterium sp.]
MSDKLITIAHLPYAKAELLKTMLQDAGINSSLKNVNLLQGAAAMGVKVKVREEDVERAWSIVDTILGKEELKDFDKENNVVVLVDFSSYAYKAAKTAFEIASRLDAKLTFYHVINQLDFLSVPYSEVVAMNAEYFENMKIREEAANQRFSSFLQKLSEEIGSERWATLENEQIIKIGYPEDDILDYIDANPPKLVVMGSKGPGVNNDIVGSTTAGVIYKSKVPVLVVPIQAKDIDYDKQVKLLYTTNFDKKDLLSIAKLLELSSEFDRYISCIHVGTEQTSALSKAKLAILQSDLEQKYPDASIHCSIVQGEDYLNTLEDYIRKNEVDLISLTTHRRGILSRLLNPSMARQMVFHSTTPLLVFHS